MINRVIVAGVTTLSLSACSVLGYLDNNTPAPNEGKASRSVAEQDPYWRRFYELEREIAQLRGELNTQQPAAAAAAEVEPLQKDETSQNAASVGLPSASSEATDARVNRFLIGIKQQADRAIDAINDVLASLSPEIEPYQEGVSQQLDFEGRMEIVQTPQDPEEDIDRQGGGGITGRLYRGESGEVVKQVNTSQQRQARYNYSVVYVYPEPKPWNEMWAKLDAANEQDKWRGYNPDKLTYFIYVGAYLKEEDAINRQESLLIALGEGPELRRNQANMAIAANN